MKIVENLDFCFKGDRTYLHGTDMYDKIVSEILKKDGRISGAVAMSIHETTNSKVNLIFDEMQPDKNYVAQFKYVHDDKDKVAYLVSNSNKVECRYPYNESKVSSNAVLDLPKSKIDLDLNIKNYSCIEYLVALNKHLLLNLYKNVKGKWFFTKLDIKNSLPQHPKKISLEVTKNMRYKLVRSDIKIDNEFWGQIYFTLV